MSWTALLPLKAAGERKTRLADQLSPAGRDALTDRLLGHVAGVLRASPLVSRLVLLSPAPPAGWPGEWLADSGHGLNAELQRARRTLTTPVLILHADLPFLTAADVAALAGAGAGGCAVAPDRHGRGTNAIALAAATPWTFAFGADSFAAHRAHGAAIVERDGLAFDLDTPDDLALAIARGLRMEVLP
ncbi:2-phospho-L-lactate guanylyltransferase [Sphingomonas jatrophae]|uniref:2-phospho-L-lactate guanylyltransferase n=1 Tax=Sphingomonas jatrophae TaxID=1166337 RepID=A0A1I6KER7_9SPHN|nr:2-phospho-L-lactate guanylyltransferase [Sphingomonas jatrophae]SFR89703.1 2-phospho-L-lactate guanylyltransferase [Sphingomonas jatrophae]